MCSDPDSCMQWCSLVIHCQLIYSEAWTETLYIIFFQLKKQQPSIKLQTNGEKFVVWNFCHFDVHLIIYNLINYCCAYFK